MKHFKLSPASNKLITVRTKSFDVVKLLTQHDITKKLTEKKRLKRVAKYEI